MNPIICIGNYRVDKKIKELMKVCNVVELKTPSTTQISGIIKTLIPTVEDDIKTKMDNVNVVFQKISEKLYSQQSPENQTEDVNVSDVDFEEVKG
jgi:uncharacterized protein YoxC